MMGPTPLATAASPNETRHAPRVVAQAAIVLLLCAAALAAQAPSRFFVGDPRERVRAVQGPPQLIERLASQGVEIWSYGRATVTFDARTERVIAYVDPERELRLAPPVRRGTNPSRFPLVLGASREAVLAQYGTPWAYTRDASSGKHHLAYGRSIVRLAPPALDVDGWIVRDSAIAVSPSERALGERAMGVHRDGGNPPVAAAPALLAGRVTWRDDDGDGVVAPGEGATVWLDVTNEGPGTALEVQGTLRVESPSEGVRVEGGAAPAGIAAGGSHRFTLRLRADSQQTAPELVVVAGAREARGFDLAPALRVRLPARGRGAPKVVVRELRVDDATHDGRLAPREMGDLTIRLANEGNASTPPLRIRFVRGADLFLAAGAPDTFALGALAPGATGDISLTIYSNTRARDVAARLELSDAGGRLIARLPLALPFTGPASAVTDVVATADPATAPARRAPLVADVERGPLRLASRRSDAIAVVLGVERYKAIPDARYAARDAALMRRYAVGALGVNDDDQHLVVRTDADVTNGEMRRLFGESGWLARRTTENTDLFVFFAGHGAPDAPRGAPYLLPFDADPAFVRETGFALADLYDRLARLPARSITIVLDACFTGLTRDARPLVPGLRPTVLSIEHPALLRRNMAVLSAARGTEAAGDLPDARYGLLTYFVARAMRGEGDSNDDGDLSIAELGAFVERGVSAAARRMDREQRPLLVARDSLHLLVRGRR